MIDLTVFTVPNLVASIVAGFVAGVTFPFFLPLDRGVALFRRSVAIAWYFGFWGSLLYAVRLAAGAVNGDPNLGRVTAGWLLWVLFVVLIGVGAAIGSSLRDRQLTK